VGVLGGRRPGQGEEAVVNFVVGEHTGDDGWRNLGHAVQADSGVAWSMEFSAGGHAPWSGCGLW
jgi:hypothetical protein